jgi:hypothetical protein
MANIHFKRFSLQFHWCKGHPFETGWTPQLRLPGLNMGCVPQTIDRSLCSSSFQQGEVKRMSMAAPALPVVGSLANYPG